MAFKFDPFQGIKDHLAQTAINLLGRSNNSLWSRLEALASAINHLSITSQPWQKFTIRYGSAQVAATSNTLTLLTLPAGHHVEATKQWAEVAFAGAGQVFSSIGISGAEDSLASAFEISDTVSASKIQLTPVMGAYSMGASQNLTITLSADSNLSLLSAGVLHVWVKIGRAQ